MRAGPDALRVQTDAGCVGRSDEWDIALFLVSERLGQF